MITILKKADRILLEMHTGMLLYGCIFEAVGIFFTKNPARFSASLWFGILLAVAATFHMSHTLNRAFQNQPAASKIITAGYVVRYVCIAAVLAWTAITGVLDTLIVFFAYMSLKVTAYLEPFTHKFYNKLFHETDPVATPMPEEEEGTDSEESEQLPDEKQ